MPNNIMNRLERLEKNQMRIEYFTAHFTDGTQKKIRPADGIGLILSENVTEFTTDSELKGCGKLLELLNSLLVVDKNATEIYL